MFDIDEEIESVESRREEACPEGLRGGSAGEDGELSSLGGNRGGREGFELTGRWPVRIMSGGGRTPFFSPLGSLPTPLFEEIPFVCNGGLLVVFNLAVIEGLLEGGSGGVGLVYDCDAV